jgi:hypothetical protein
VNDRCPRCDRPIATDADWTTTPSGEGGHLCWGGACPAVDWRKRALVAEAEVDTLLDAIDAQAAAVRQHDAAQAAIRAADARDAATLRRREATPGDVLAELAAAREEARRWNARATELEAERDALRAAIDAQAAPLGEAQRLHDHVETALRRHVKAITQEALDAPEVSCG